MRRPLLVLVLLSVTALAKPTSFEPSITFGETTFEVRGQDLTAHTGSRVLWKHGEDPGFHYQDLQIEENHVVVMGVLDDTPFHPQVVVLDLKGQEVARTDGRFLLAEGGHFYVDQLFPRKTLEGLPDIDVVDLNTKAHRKEHWKVKAPVLPEPCLVQGEEPYPFHRFVEKEGERWQFRYFAGPCEVLGTFQEGVWQFQVQKVEVNPGPSSRHPFSFLTYLLLLLPLLMLGKKGGVWAPLITLLMAVVTWEAVHFQLFFYPPFLFPLLLWALITLLVTLWRKWKKQTVNIYLSHAALSTCAAFAALWLQEGLGCWRQWGC